MACRGGRIHTQWGCREVLYEEGPQGAEATGLRMTKAGKEQIVEADVYVAALDVPGTLSHSSLRTSSLCVHEIAELALARLPIRQILARCSTADKWQV